MLRFGIFAGSSALTAAVTSKSIFATSPANDKKIKLSELPLYDNESNEPSFEIEKEDISLFRSYISEARKFTWEYVGSLEGVIASIKDKYNVAETHTKETLAYIHEDSAVLPRIAIIAVAGLGGVVAGYRGGIFKKVIYSSIAITTAASICYPKEAYDIGQKGWDYLKDTTNDLWSHADQKSKATEKASDASEKVEEVKDVAVKDFGMSNPADKDMYSKRSK